MTSYLYDRSIRGLTLLTPPTVEPITLARAKQHLRLETAFTADDTYVADLIVAARQWVERYTGRAICNQQWRLTLDRFPVWGDSDDPYFWLYRRGIIDLTKPPLVSVDALHYVGTDGTTQTLVLGTDFIADIQADYARIEPVYGSFWPPTQFRISSVYIDATSGYTNTAGDPSNAVPVSMKQAMLMLIGSFYEVREEASGLPKQRVGFGVDDLLSPYQVWSFPT